MYETRRRGRLPRRDREARAQLLRQLSGAATARMADSISGLSSVERSPGSSPLTPSQQDPAVDLARPGQGHRIHDEHRLGAKRLAERLGRRGSTTSPGSDTSAFRAGVATTTMTGTWPLVGWGTPTAAAAMTPSTSTAMDSISVGPIRLPATFKTSSDQPDDLPRRVQAWRTARSPWTHRPGRVDPVPDREVALRLAPQPLRHVRPARRRDQLTLDAHEPDTARTSTTSASMPSAGPENRPPGVATFG